MTMNPREFADSDAEKIRADALRMAVYVEHELPPPTTPDSTPRSHRSDEACDCPPVTADQYTGMIRLVEEATIDRVMRNTQRFHDWIRHGITPELARERELRAMQDGLD
jgi:hypothetical protein